MSDVSTTLNRWGLRIAAVIAIGSIIVALLRIAQSRSIPSRLARRERPVSMFTEEVASPPTSTQRQGRKKKGVNPVATKQTQSLRRLRAGRLPPSLCRNLQQTYNNATPMRPVMSEPYVVYDDAISTTPTRTLTTMVTPVVTTIRRQWANALRSRVYCWHVQHFVPDTSPPHHEPSPTFQAVVAVCNTYRHPNAWCYVAHTDGNTAASYWIAFATHCLEMDRRQQQESDNVNVPSFLSRMLSRPCLLIIMSNLPNALCH